jgi:hypothetical protein
VKKPVKSFKTVEQKTVAPVIQEVLKTVAFEEAIELPFVETSNDRESEAASGESSSSLAQD